ncbi:MAG: TetR/AcrR family transcriptional regulator [Sporomusaceae bacterium]|nr:TetR/AcrR family transcriptional regulator [Sporomusaceae bacterium]
MTEKKATETRRDEIITASLKLIEEKGLDNLSVADIAAAINLVPSAIYRHFGGKEDIIECLVDFVDRSLQANVARVAGGKAAVEKLELLYKLHTDFLRTQPAIPLIMFSLLAGNRNPALKQRMISVIASYVAEVRNIIAKGQPQGEIAAAIDPMSAALLFVGMIQPLIILNQAGDNSVDAFKKPLWDVYARGIGK